MSNNLFSELHKLVDDLSIVNQTALNTNWFVSPLEFHWSDGVDIFKKKFNNIGSQTEPSSIFDRLCGVELYKTSMNIKFRAQMMVYAYMRQTISKSFGLEIENGLMHLYRLDFVSCLSQWIYVIEGYCRKLFNVKKAGNTDPQSWNIPVTNDDEYDYYIKKMSECLSKYLKKVFFKGDTKFNTEILRRNIILHGNSENTKVYNQKNCLILMFLLDALVTIEMASQKKFPSVFSSKNDEDEKISRRVTMYKSLMDSAFEENNILRISILDEHH